MKYLYISLTATLLIFTYSCKKAETDTDQTFGFTISDIKDFVLEADGTEQMSVEFNATSDATENVSIEILGLPDNVTHEFIRGNGSPTFYGIIKLQGNYAAVGNYKVTVKGVSSSGITQTKDFQLKITNANNCVDRMAGKYGDVTINKAPGANSTLAIERHPNDVYPEVKMTLNCVNKTFSIHGEGSLPNGNVHISYSGQGSFKPFNEISGTYYRKSVFGGNPTPPFSTTKIDTFSFVYKR